jgi:signal transduction histidine kinase
VFAPAFLRAAVARWPGLPIPAKDAALAALVVVLACVPTLSGLGPEIGDLPERHAGTVKAVVGVVLALAMCVPLAVRSQRSHVCLVVIGAAFAVGQVLGYPETFGKVGLLLALYAAGAHLVRFRRGVAAVMTAGYVVLAVVLHELGSPQRFPDFLAFYLILAVIWQCGTAVRRWRAADAERERLAAELATSAERARIARDLHDVVTHHVTAMVVQADAAQYLVGTAPARAGDGMVAISDTGRRALTELRSLLGMLEATGVSPTSERTPSAGRLDDLVERARKTGQPVEWAERGERRSGSAAVELAAYRVVQESLTNAIKYATGRPTTVLVRHGDEHIEIEVTTAGPAVHPTPAVPPSGGRGLNGLRERVRMLDGDLVVGPRPDGGFRVRAWIPSEGES